MRDLPGGPVGERVPAVRSQTRSTQSLRITRAARLVDNHQTSEAGRIAEAFAVRMPRATLRLVSNDCLAATDGLAGDVDAAFAPSILRTPGVHARPVFEEQACLVVRRDHPRVRGKLTPKVFRELPHIDVDVVLGKPGVGGRLTEQHWKDAGLERKVTVRVPYFATAALIASRTDCIAALPSRLARVLCNTMPIKVAATTFPCPRWASRSCGMSARTPIRGAGSSGTWSRRRSTRGEPTNGK